MVFDIDMVTEDYVSFETAKLLKEKGFDAAVNYYYNKDGSEMCSIPSYNWNDGPFYSKCTLQMAMKWLREVHNLHCHSDYDYVLGWYCQITNLKETVEYDYKETVEYDCLEMKHYHPEKDNGFSSPEEACEAAIKYCLENLI